MVHGSSGGAGGGGCRGGGGGGGGGEGVRERGGNSCPFFARAERAEYLPAVAMCQKTVQG